jgi:hypothetical protein
MAWRRRRVEISASRLAEIHAPITPLDFEPAVYETRAEIDAAEALFDPS